MSYNWQQQGQDGQMPPPDPEAIQQAIMAAQAQTPAGYRQVPGGMVIQGQGGPQVGYSPQVQQPYQMYPQGYGGQQFAQSPGQGPPPGPPPGGPPQGRPMSMQVAPGRPPSQQMPSRPNPRPSSQRMAPAQEPEQPRVKVERWHYEAILQFLASPIWLAPIQQFVDERCVEFGETEDGAGEFQALHNEYAQLVERLLEQYLSDVGISHEQFSVACEKLMTNRIGRNVFDLMLAADDFSTFCQMMIKRNSELDQEALQTMEQRQAASYQKSMEMQGQMAAAIGLDPSLQKAAPPVPKPEVPSEWIEYFEHMGYPKEQYLPLYCQQLGYPQEYCEYWDEEAKNAELAMRGVSGQVDDEMRVALQASREDQGRADDEHDELEMILRISMKEEEDRKKAIADEEEQMRVIMEMSLKQARVEEDLRAEEEKKRNESLRDAAVKDASAGQPSTATAGAVSFSGMAQAAVVKNRFMKVHRKALALAGKQASGLIREQLEQVATQMGAAEVAKRQQAIDSAVAAGASQAVAAAIAAGASTADAEQMMIDEATGSAQSQPSVAQSQPSVAQPSVAQASVAQVTTAQPSMAQSAQVASEGTGAVAVPVQSTAQVAHVAASTPRGKSGASTSKAGKKAAMKAAMAAAAAAQAAAGIPGDGQQTATQQAAVIGSTSTFGEQKAGRKGRISLIDSDDDATDDEMEVANKVDVNAAVPQTIAVAQRPALPVLATPTVVTAEPKSSTTTGLAGAPKSSTVVGLADAPKIAAPSAGVSSIGLSAAVAGSLADSVPEEEKHSIPTPVAPSIGGGSAAIGLSAGIAGTLADEGDLPNLGAKGPALPPMQPARQEAALPSLPLAENKPEPQVTLPTPEPEPAPQSSLPTLAPIAGASGAEALRTERKRLLDERRRVREQRLLEEGVTAPVTESKPAPTPKDKGKKPINLHGTYSSSTPASTQPAAGDSRTMLFQTLCKKLKADLETEEDRKKKKGARRARMQARAKRGNDQPAAPVGEVIADFEDDGF